MLQSKCIFQCGIIHVAKSVFIYKKKVNIQIILCKSRPPSRASLSTYKHPKEHLSLYIYIYISPYTNTFSVV